MSTLADVSIVTVAYHSGAVLPAMMESLPAGPELVVVDNGEDDGMRAAAAGRGARVIVAGGNVGFGPACNIGADAARRNVLFFLNPDTVLLPGALDALLAGLDRHPGAGALGPLQETGAGAPFFKRRTRILPGLPVLTPDPPTADTKAPVLSGAAMLIPRAAFEAVDGFDPAIFLYYEDDDISIRLARQVGPLWLIAAARVRHLGGAADTSGAAGARRRGWHRARARIHVARKYGTALPRPRVLASALFRLMSPRRLVRPLDRAEALGRLAGAWSMPGGRGA